MLAGLPENSGGSIFVKVNDGFMPAGIETLANLELPVLVAEDVDNVGFGRGHAWAYEQSLKNDWLFCINPDVELPQSFPSVLQQGLASLSSEVALVGVPIGRESSTVAPRPSGRQALAFIAAIFGVKPPRRRVTEPYAVPGAFFGIRKIDELVPFDDRVFLFYEEMILAEKIWRLGLKAQMLDVPCLEHRVGASRSLSDHNLLGAYLRAQGVYLRDYLDWPSPLVTLLAQVSRLRLIVSGGV